MSDKWRFLSEKRRTPLRFHAYTRHMSDQLDQSPSMPHDGRRAHPGPDLRSKASSTPGMKKSGPKILDDPAVEAVVATALSRFLCETKSPLMRPVNYLGHTLALYAATEVA